MHETMGSAEFVDRLLDAGFDFFTGVPCSLAAGLIATLEAGSGYIAETREDAAVGLAAGSHLAGKRPVVIMQNSGLGVCLNALASLSILYELPCLLLITWRGYQGQDAPEHLMMGEITPSLLATLGIPYRGLHTGRLAESVTWAAQRLVQTKRPVALLLPAGVLT